VKNKGPNFGGHYFVVNWGCGTGCLMMVVVDAITGHVYPPPLSIGNAGNQKIGRSYERRPMGGFRLSRQQPPVHDANLPGTRRL
jgi:hypothetical protein